jgi:hypothetical protein
MKREVVNKIKKFKAKGKEEKISKWVQNTFTQVEQMVQRRI